MSSITVAEFEKALQSLQEALQLYDKSNSEIEKKAFRDAAIQRFEFSIELSWKTSMKALGSNTLAAKNAIREMARNDLIDNPEEWIRFIDGRNETSHSYDENVALRVFKIIQQFLPHAQNLLQQLKKMPS
jgi:nucleotidyltransferase substrate binding protein (TIGR01987 family)